MSPKTIPSAPSQSRIEVPASSKRAADLASELDQLLRKHADYAAGVVDVYEAGERAYRVTQPGSQTAGFSGTTNGGS